LENENKNSHRKPKLWEALIPVFLLMIFIGVTIIKFKSQAHIPLILSACVASVMTARLGFTWKEIEDGMIHGITLGLQAALILMIVGTLIGTWILGGIVPAMIYYGLKLISPSIFLVTTCIICSLVSLSTGSSWSTAGTVGIAFIGIGNTLGIPSPMVAGAIISGAYFGDKMSPLSDTTNLAPATAGTDLFTHIRHMVYTTAPSLFIALILYTFLGMKYGNVKLDTGDVDLMLHSLENNFTITPWLLIPPAMVIFMVIFRIPALPALVGGSILGGILAGIFQANTLPEIIDTALNGYVADTGITKIDELLSRGGLISMMSTVALIFCAMSFGGIMEKSGMLETIASAVLKFAVSTGSLIVTTIFTCIGFNVISSDQYISIIIPGRMYREAFLKRGLHPKNLSRALEDSGTLSSPLIPWNTCGAFMHGALGISPFLYLPFAFLNLINPVVSIFYGFTGLTMHKIDDEEDSLN